MDYLTEGAEFICNQGGRISCKDSDNKKVTYNNKILLTTSASVNKKFGYCAILTAAAQGTPQNCKCQLTKWLPGFSPLKISSNNPLLTDTAKNFCSVGGNISVMTSGVRGHITTGSISKNNSVAPAKVADKKISDEQNKNFSAQANSQNHVDNKKISPQFEKRISKNLFCPYNEDDKNCKLCEYPRTSNCAKIIMRILPMKIIAMQQINIT